MLKCRILWALTLTIMLATTGRLEADRGDPKKVQIAILNSNLNIDDLDAISSIESENQVVKFLYGFVRRPVFSLNKDWKFSCSICTETPKLKITETNRNTKNYTVSLLLKENLKWSDGRTVSEKDFRFTWILGKSIFQRTKHQKFFFDSIINIESNPDNPREVSIVFKDDITDPNKLFQFHLLPRHVHQPLWRESQHNPKNFLKNMANLTNSNLQVASTNFGPFVIQKSFSIKKSSSIDPPLRLCLDKNEFFKPEPKITEVCLAFFPTLENLVSSTKHNTNFDIIIDFKNGLTPISKSSFKDLKRFTKSIRQDTEDMKIFWYQRPKIEVLAFNLRNPILNQAALRETIQFAVYASLYQYVSEQVLNPALGNLPDFLNIYPIDHPFYIPIKPILSPLKQAKLKLEKSGFHLNENKIRYKQGKSLDLSISFARSYSKRFYTAALIKSSLEKLGIKVESNPTASGQFYKSTLPEIRYPSLAVFGINLSYPNKWSELLHSEEVPKKNNKFTGQNVFSWIHSNADNVLEDIEQFKKKLSRASNNDEITSTEWYFETKKYKQKILALESFLREDLPFLPLYFYGHPLQINRDLKGVSLPSHNFPFSFYSEYWEKSNNTLTISAKKRADTLKN